MFFLVWCNVEASAAEAEVREPLNCPMMITAVSEFSKWEHETFLRLSLDVNANFDSQKIDVCDGDIKYLWPDISRFEAEIESHAPYVRGWFNTPVIMRNFPKTEHELKRFIDDTSKAEGLPDVLNKIERSNLEGGLEYNNQIVSLIRQQERAYWNNQHSSLLDVILSKYGASRFSVSSEKLAYCYHPHNYCRGYSLYYQKSPDHPQSHIGAVSDYDLEHLWSAFGLFSFELNAPD